MERTANLVPKNQIIQDDMMDRTDRPIVSFCIATFRRYELVKELIQEILSVPTDKIEVVVCDNNSQDGSIEKIGEIRDPRLKIYINKKNLGSLLNMYEALDKGKGRYLFYVNDRDNVDSFKIGKLIDILEKLEKEDVAFAQCVENQNAEKYHIFDVGKDSLIQFACRMNHPTGYIFKRDIWKKIKNKRTLFENQIYGDYSMTQVCAIMARKYKGALVYGDICDIKRLRINFSEEKSRYYEKRKDKRLWYTPEVIFRELKIGQKFLEKIGVEVDIRKQILTERYTEYLRLSVTNYKIMIADPECTAHYNFYPRQDFFHVFITSVLNGIKLWSRTIFLCMSVDRKLISQINKATKEEYAHYFKCVLESELPIKKKTAKILAERDYEIVRRDAILDNYEMWVDALLSKKMISQYLKKNGYCHLAIYGMGRVGKNLYKELKDSEISVDFIMDQKISGQQKYYGDVPCLTMESEFPYVDMIIVTISGETDQVISKLRKKVTCPVKAIDDILFVME